jgi:hypothetical protein
MDPTYYKKNKNLWKKGGKYYYYKPKEFIGQLTIRRGRFLVYFE